VTGLSKNTARGESLGGSLKRLGWILADWKLCADKRAELGLFLQRSFWTPLRNTKEIFHVLPLLAAVIIAVLLATEGQAREIYISYLEGPSGHVWAWAVSILAAVTAVTLISAVLYQAHHALSTMRINVIFSSHSDPRADSRLPRLQRAAAFLLAFMPWLGLVFGLLNARNFVAARYCQLLTVAQNEIAVVNIEKMHPLPELSGVPVAAAAIALGAVSAFFVSVDDRNRSAHYAVAFLSPALAALLFLLFTDWLNAGTWMPWWTWVYSAVLLATAAYLAGYRRLYHRRGGSLLSRPFIRTGISFRKRRRVRLAVWALLPWLAIAFYFLHVHFFVPGALQADSCSDPLISAVTVPGPGRWTIFPVAMCCTIAIGLLVSHFLVQLGSTQWLEVAVRIAVCALVLAVALLSLHHDDGLIVAVYRLIGPLATIGLVMLFLLSTFAVLAVLSQHSGFPALTLIALTIVVCVIFPDYAGWTAFALGLVYFSFAVAAFVSGRVWAGAMLMLLIVVGVINLSQFNEGPMVPQNRPEPAVASASSAPPARSLQTDYLCWLDQRGIPPARTPEQQTACGARPEHPRPASGRYPVIIVAAEGGGIYAASAAAMFLAKLEDFQPGFARHVFAISGVSGGSIGAAVFQALDLARQADSGAGSGASTNAAAQVDGKEQCAQHAAAAPRQDLTHAVASIMQDDHLSPVLGSIFPEIFGAPLKRPHALTASFEYSAFSQDPQAGRNLCARFLDHWSPAAAAPALVLNSTWVETGFRVAFAPFRLHDLDESLYSFVDPSMPDEDCPQTVPGPQACVSLMTAAGVSARFPAVMPPFSMKLQADKRWNFVDGGYADNSGATTALAIYHALEHAIASADVDLRIVVITSANAQPNLEDRSINGTVFRDTVAPIDALLKVRADLGHDAVARACSDIYGDEARSGGHQSCVAPAHVMKGPLQIVEIQDQTYGLPLGWKISRTSFAVIDWMLGNPLICPDAARDTGEAADPQPSPQQPAAQDGNATSDLLNRPPPVGGTVSQTRGVSNAQLNDVILLRNSCVAWSLAQLVEKSSVPVGK